MIPAAGVGSLVSGPLEVFARNAVINEIISNMKVVQSSSDTPTVKAGKLQTEFDRLAQIMGPREAENKITLEGISKSVYDWGTKMGVPDLGDFATTWNSPNYQTWWRDVIDKNANSSGYTGALKNSYVQAIEARLFNYLNRLQNEAQNSYNNGQWGNFNRAIADQIFGSQMGDQKQEFRKNYYPLYSANETDTLRNDTIKDMEAWKFQPKPQAAYIMDYNADKPSYSVNALGLLGPQIAIQQGRMKKRLDLYKTKYISKNDLENKALQNPYWTWSDEYGKNILVPKALSGRFKKGLGTENFMEDYAKRREKSNVLLGKQATEADVQAVVPSMVKSIVNADKNLGLVGFGPLNTKGLPFYAGRYIDPKTGAIKSIGSPSTKFINPTNLNELLAFRQAKVLSSWNNYVRAEQQLEQFYQKVAEGKNPAQSWQTSFAKLKTEAGKQKFIFNKLKGLAIKIVNGENIYGLTPQKAGYGYIKQQLQSADSNEDVFVNIGNYLEAWAVQLSSNFNVFVQTNNPSKLAAWIKGARDWLSSYQDNIEIKTLKSAIPDWSTKNYSDIAQLGAAIETDKSKRGLVNAKSDTIRGAKNINKRANTEIRAGVNAFSSVPKITYARPP